MPQNSIKKTIFCLFWMISKYIKSNFSSSQATVGRLGLGQLGSHRLGSGRLGSGRLGSGQWKWGRRDGGGEVGRGVRRKAEEFFVFGYRPQGGRSPLISSHMDDILSGFHLVRYKHFLIHLSLIEFDSKVLVIWHQSPCRFIFHTNLDSLWVSKSAGWMIAEKSDRNM